MELNGLFVYLNSYDSRITKLKIIDFQLYFFITEKLYSVRFMASLCNVD